MDEALIQNAQDDVDHDDGDDEQHAHILGGALEGRRRALELPWIVAACRYRSLASWMPVTASLSV